MTIKDYIDTQLPKIHHTIYIAAKSLQTNADEDLYQDVLVKLWMTHDRYSDHAGENGFYSLVWQTSRWTIIDRFKTSTQKFVDLKFAEDKLVIEQKCMSYRHELALYYRELRRNFKPEYARLMYMRSQGYKDKDLEVIFKIPNPTIRDIFHKIRKYLRGEIQIKNSTQWRTI